MDDLLQERSWPALDLRGSLQDSRDLVPGERPPLPFFDIGLVIPGGILPEISVLYGQVEKIPEDLEVPVDRGSLDFPCEVIVELIDVSL